MAKSQKSKTKESNVDNYSEDMVEDQKEASIHESEKDSKGNYASVKQTSRISSSRHQIPKAPSSK